MPLGPYATFGECVGAQKRKGHSDESAHKICGALEQQASSPIAQYGAEGMSQIGAFPPKAEDSKPKPEGDNAKIEMDQPDAQVIASFIMNAETAFQSGEVTPELQQQLEEAKAVIQKVMNVQPEPEGEAGPPPQ